MISTLAFLGLTSARVTTFDGLGDALKQLDVELEKVSAIAGRLDMSETNQKFDLSSLRKLKDEESSSQNKEMEKMLEEQQKMLDQQMEAVDELRNLIFLQNHPAHTSYGALRTELDMYPGYTGSQKITGWVEVFENLEDGSLELRYMFDGLEPSTTGGFHIHAGTSCYDENLPGGHFYNMTSDPWASGSMWASDAMGKGFGNNFLKTGYPLLSDNAAHVIVVHLADGTKAACGALCPISGLTTTTFAPYDGYTGNLNIQGHVLTSPLEGKELQLAYMFTGLEPSTSGGFHIHVGMDCKDGASIGGHHFNADIGFDPWSAGSKWVSDSMGNGYGLVTIDSGYANLATNYGHTVVVHEAGGTKAACAELNPIKSIFSTMSKFPGYMGDLNVMGNVSASVNAKGESLLTWQLDGLEHDLWGGIHIHEGLTCDDAGGHYYDEKMFSVDPWKKSTWTSGENGRSVGTKAISDGFFQQAQNYHHAVVVHANNGDKIACGELTMPLVYLETYVTSYRGSALTGHVMITMEQTGKLVVSWDLDGDLKGGEMIQVLDGTDCESSSLGNQFHTLMTPEGEAYEAMPWNNAVVATNKGTYKVDIGTRRMADLLGHLVVLATNTGEQLACGEIYASNMMFDGPGDMPDPTPMTTAKPDTPDEGEAPDVKMLLKNNSLVNRQTCAIMEADYGDQWDQMKAFTMDDNGCDNPSTAKIHTPSTMLINGKIRVSVEHPVQMSSHWIEWLYLGDANGNPIVWKKMDQPAEGVDGETPVTADFDPEDVMSKLPSGEPMYPFIYCNLHGLWQGDKVSA